MNYTQPTVLFEEATATQTLSTNGVTKTVQIISKTSPFVIDVIFPNMPPTKTKYSAQLLYDGENEGELVPVESLRHEPMTAKIHVTEATERVSISCRLHVLTSQHEDSLFRVRITAYLLGDPSISFSCLSSPIWVVSKTSQALKMVERGPKPLPAAPVAVSLKRKENVVDILERMERRQLEMMRRLPDPVDVDFDDAFDGFLRAYSRLSSGERAAKMRRMAASEEFLDICAGVTCSTDTLLAAPCCSDEVCQHQKELDSMQQLFDQFVNSPDSTPEI